MKLAVRANRQKTIQVGEQSFIVEIFEIPFREGVELRCVVAGEEIRISDRQLGENEALRLMSDEITKRLKEEK